MSLSHERSVLPISDREPPTTTTRDVRSLESVGSIEQVTAPAGAPNVVVVLLDDMGFGASSAFGGPCQMPTAEKLSSDGAAFTRFHTTALCSPTRQALMTGRNHHAVNMGTVTNMATPVPGYTSVRPNTAATLPEILRLNGYSTAAFGKMHQTPAWETSSAGPFDRWPTGEGFEKFYGFIGGGVDQYAPLLYDGTQPIDVPDDPDYHFSADMTDQAIGWLRSQRVHTPEKPFFMYVSFGATHAPHHAPPEWIEKYRGRFDLGWDAEREQILARQKTLGVVPEDCDLTRRHDEIPAWDSLSDGERKVAARLMEAYAGFAEHTDHQIGRLVAALEESRSLSNTVFLYILGDNGASGEGGLDGAFNEVASLNGIHDSTEAILPRLDEIGGPSSYNHYPVGWAHATNTPFQWTKQVASHWGGTRVGMVAHWPQGISNPGDRRHQWHHVIDVYPTILEACGLPVPTTVNGVTQQRLDGVSFSYAFEDQAGQERHTTQYFEMFGNRGIYHEGWMACTNHSVPWKLRADEIPSFDDDVWELYAPEDWSQAHDIAAERPDVLDALKALFNQEAERNHVLPMDDRKVERFHSGIAGRPTLLDDRTSVTLHPGMTRLVEAAIPNIRNRSHTVTAEVTLADDRADGVIIAHGARFGGWVLRLKEGRLVYDYNYLGRRTYEVASDEVVGAGRRRVTMDFDYGQDQDFGGRGHVRLLVDGVEVGRGTVEATVPFYYGPTCANVGLDIGSGVVQDYTTRGGKFTGQIHTVTIDAAPDSGPRVPAATADRIDIATQ